MRPHCGLVLLLVGLSVQSNVSLSAEPMSRPFALAMTPVNFDDTREGIERMQRLLRDHAEVVALYFSGGVPWPEAFEGKPFHANVEKEIAAMKERIGPNHKVFLALNAGAFNRREMAAYWGSERGMRRPGRWAHKSFDDPEIITAFGNYCQRMIEIFQPDYLCYAIEINMLAGANPEEFDKLVTLAGQVYPRLKKAHPTMMIFPTMQRDYHFEPNDDTAKALRRLLPYSDAVAVSTYPHLRGFTPETLPEDWFTALRDMAPDKPFLIAETGFPAERYEGSSFNKRVSVAATPQMQREYVRRMLTDAHRLNARLVTWFFPEDINAYLRGQVSPAEDRTKNLLSRIASSWLRKAAAGFTAGWFNLGLCDERRERRPAMDEWDRWRALRRELGG
jgi:hypothetical protein